MTDNPILRLKKEPQQLQPTTYDNDYVNQLFDSVASPATKNTESSNEKNQPLSDSPEKVVITLPISSPLKTESPVPKPEMAYSTNLRLKT